MGILCEHGCLGLKRQAQPISAVGWQALKSLFPEAMEVPTQPRCVECSTGSKEESEKRRLEKKNRLDHLSGELGALYRRKAGAGVGLAVEPSTLGASPLLDQEVWHVVPSRWLTSWRAWVDGAGAVDAPPSLEACLAERLICPCKAGIFEPLSLAAIAPHLGVQVDACPTSDAAPRATPATDNLWTDDADAMELVSAAEYRELAERYKGESVDALCGVYLTAPYDSLGNRALARWSSPVCDSCTADRKAEREKTRTNFSNATIQVKKLSDGVPLPDAPSALGVDRQVRSSSKFAHRLVFFFNHKPICFGDLPSSLSA
jgi:hypothetical protein